MTDINETALGMAIREAEEKGFHRNAAPVAFAIRAYRDALGPQAVDIEAGAKAIRDHETNHCGLSLPDGRTVFCDDERLEGELDGYGKPLRCNVCHCKVQAQACAAAWGLSPGAGKEGGDE